MPFKVHIGFFRDSCGELKGCNPLILSGLTSLTCPVRAIKGS